MTLGMAIDGALAETSRRFTARQLSGPGDPFLVLVGTPASVFQSRRHIETVLATIGAAEDAEPVFIGVTDNAGRPVALFPFVLRRTRGLRLIEGLDFDVSDYFAPAWFDAKAPTPAETDRIWAAVLRALPRADAVGFKKLPRLVGNRPHALSAFRRLRPMAAAATTLTLAPDFDPQRLSVARDARRKLRKLEAMGKVTFTVATEPAEIEEALTQLVAFRVERFAELGRPDILTRREVRDFYRAMATTHAGRAPGHVFALRVGTEIVAAIYAFCADGVFTLIIPAISSDPRWRAGSPGLVALFQALEWSVAHGYRSFDLSVGSMHYKTRFDADEIELHEYQQPLTPAGWILVAEAGLRRLLRTQARKHPRLRTFLERLRSPQSKAAAGKSSDA